MPDDTTPVQLTDREREWICALVRRAAKAFPNDPLGANELRRAVGGNSGVVDLVYRLGESL